jgi:CheY-like chemotaxis protein
MAINSLVESVEGVISEFIDKKHQITFTYAADTNYCFTYDRLRIEQVIRNLISNAIKHSMDTNIIIELKNEGGFTKFSIADEGIGIPESELEEIFKIFVQGSRTVGSGGTGSGLAISETIVKDHGGTIWAQNNSNGSGSIFTFKIPSETVNQKNIKSYDNLKDNSFKPKSLLREIPADAPNLLLIDDESSILQVSKLVFERIGFRVTLADSGLRGMEVLEKSLVSSDGDFKIDVILLDMMLTDLSGIEVLKAIKEDERLRPIPPIYIYSGMGLEDEIQKAIALGASGFIDKTSSSKQIERVLGKYLKKKSQEGQSKIETKELEFAIIDLLEL